LNAVLPVVRVQSSPVALAQAWAALPVKLYLAANG
jgi:hypothetical protein